MNKFLITFKLVIVTGLILLMSCKAKRSDNPKQIKQSEQPEKIKWENMRGVNIEPGIKEEDFQALKLWGANVARIAFATQPFMELKEPYNFNEETFKNLDRILDLCEKYKIKLVIDPHRFPGMWHQWTMINNDEYWTDFAWHEKTIEVWKRIAMQCKDRGDVIAAYDLLNEPALPEGSENDKNTPTDLNLLYRKLIAAVREHDTIHTIMIAAPRYTPKGNKTELSYIYGLDVLEPPVEDNLCYTIHIYDPGGFTHQDVYTASDFVKYPGFIDGEDWNKEKLHSFMKRAKDFTDKYNAPMFIGEFSCVRWSGDYGNQYLKDVIEVYEEYGFSWAYHAFRENQIWDVEMNIYDRADSLRRETTPRKELLLKAFSLNESQSN